jgi:type IV pilus assembly protein PilC
MPRSLFVHFSTKERMLVVKRLSFLSRSGMPILQCLDIIRHQLKGAKRGFIAKAMQDIESGQPLCVAFAMHPKLFTDFDLQLISIGEQQGLLAENLEYLAEDLHKREMLRRKIIGALLYPLLVSGATVGLTAALTSYIFPKLEPIFAGLHVTLPLTTRLLIATSRFLSHWGFGIFFVLCALVVLYTVIRKRYYFLRHVSDATLLRVPLVGTLTKKYALATMCRTLGLLLKSGVSLRAALHMSARASHNTLYQAAGAQIAVAFAQGETLSTILARTPALYPDMLVHLVAAAEVSGTLPESFLYLSSLYESDVDEITKNLSSSIEPLLMVLMGLLVGLVAVSVITPLYEITQHLQTY